MTRKIYVTIEGSGVLMGMNDKGKPQHRIPRVRDGWKVNARKAGPMAHRIKTRGGGGAKARAIQAAMQ